MFTAHLSAIPSLRQAPARFQSSSSTLALSSLRGTVQPHNALILLHSVYPPPTFPARGPVSQVSKRLQLAAVKWGGVVNWVYDQSQTKERKDPVDIYGEWYSATLFSKHGRLQFPRVSVDNVDEVGEMMRRVTVDLNGLDSGDQGRSDNVVQLLICTHMARDCRCGEVGGAFVQRLREEVERAQICYGNAVKCTLKIGEVGHVGGHQYAPNLLIYPYGDWYGLLSPAQIPQILGDIQEAAESRGVRPLGRTEELLLVSHGLKEHWKGRMGMSREEQIVLAERLGLGIPAPA